MLNSRKRALAITVSKVGLGLFWLAMFIGTHIPPRTELIPIETNDKVLHFGAYLGLALGAATAWQLAGGILTVRHLVFAWLAIVAYGAFDEITQIPVGRDCSSGDWMFDALGAATGLVLFVALRRFIAPRLQWSDEPLSAD